MEKGEDCEGINCQHGERINAKSKCCTKSLVTVMQETKKAVLEKKLSDSNLDQDKKEVIKTELRLVKSDEKLFRKATSKSKKQIGVTDEEARILEKLLPGLIDFLAQHQVGKDIAVLAKKQEQLQKEKELEETKKEKEKSNDGWFDWMWGNVTWAWDKIKAGGQALWNFLWDNPFGALAVSFAVFVLHNFLCQQLTKYKSKFPPIKVEREHTKFDTFVTTLMGATGINGLKNVLENWIGLSAEEFFGKIWAQIGFTTMIKSFLSSSLGSLQGIATTIVVTSLSYLFQQMIAKVISSVLNYFFDKLLQLLSNPKAWKVVGKLALILTLIDILAFKQCLRKIPVEFVDASFKGHKIKVSEYDSLVKHMFYDNPQNSQEKKNELYNASLGYFGKNAKKILSEEQLEKYRLNIARLNYNAKEEARKLKLPSTIVQIGEAQNIERQFYRDLKNEKAFDQIKEADLEAEQLSRLRKYYGYEKKLVNKLADLKAESEYPETTVAEKRDLLQDYKDTKKAHEKVLDQIKKTREQFDKGPSIWENFTNLFRTHLGPTAVPLHNNVNYQRKSGLSPERLQYEAIRNIT